MDAPQPEPLRVLAIGRLSDAPLAAELERAGYAPIFAYVRDEEELRAALLQPWDIALSDFRIDNHFGAIEAMRIIRELAADLPLIVVSDTIGDAELVAVLKAGAADHIQRANLQRLNSAVGRERRAARARRDRLRLEEQFRQAQKMEAVGRLAGGVAHDFNNLLTIITGYSDLLLVGKDLSTSQRSALEEIRRSAERGGALTRQLLAFSRRQPLDVRAVQINLLLVKLEGMLRRLIGEDIELITLPVASQDGVAADPGRLEQVLLNLVVNARDAMPGGGKLTIESGTVNLDEAFSARQLGVEPGAYVTLSITDTGCGMDEETQSHLFEPFFTTKRPGQGTGLGLATAYGIIRQSQGAITVFSEKGQGTTVRIYLPRSAEPASPEARESFAPLRARGAETVLVVEDEARVRKLIAGVLAGHGYRILEAGRGSDALRIAGGHNGPIDLALVDVIMPEMSGPELVRRMAPVRPEMRVLYVSGYTDEALVHHHVTESGSEFLQKPFLPDVLARKVREVLDAPPVRGD